MPATPLSPITLSVLLALVDQPRHGYAIIKQVELETGGTLSLEAGTLYAAIKRLQDQGLIEPDVTRRASNDDSRRRYYRLTAAGRRQLRAETHEWSETAALMERFIAAKAEDLA